MAKKTKRKQRKVESYVAPQWHGMWDRLSTTKQHVVSLSILLILTVSFFAPIHFSEKQLVASDTVQWRSMAQSMLEYEEETGGAALWAGRVFGGMPGYMISPELSVPQIDTLVRELRKMAWPSSHLMLLFAGMYLLAWYVTRESLASLMASVAYGFTTYLPVILVAGHNSKFVALAWAPWMMLAFIHSMRSKTLVSGLLFAVALAANLRAGHVQITYYVTIAAGIWWLVEGVQSVRMKELSSFIRATGVLVLGSVLGLMMVAQPYLAHAEVMPFTTRGSSAGGGAGGMAWEYAMAWSQGFGELLTLIIADARGGASPLYWGPKTVTAGPHHLGAIVVFLCALTVWTVRDKTTWSLVIGIVVVVAFSLGEYLPIINRPMFDYFPMFSSFRVPETWLSIAAFLAALLAARGLVSLRRKSGDKGGVAAGSTWKVFGVIAGFLLIMNVFGTSLLSFEKPFERERIISQIQAQNPGISPSDPRVQDFVSQNLAESKETRLERFGADAMRSLLVLLLVGAMILLYQRRTIPYWTMAGLIVLIVAIDLMGIGRRHIRDDRLSPVSDVEESVPRYAFDEFILAQREIAGGEGSFRVLSLEGGSHPQQNARPSFHYESLGGYSAAKLRVYQDFMEEMLFNDAGLNTAALDVMQVQYLVASRGIPGYNLVFQDDQTGMSVFENPDVLGRAFFVDRVTQVADHVALWRRFSDPSFDASTEALVYETSGLAASMTVSVDADTLGLHSVVLESYEAERQSFRVESDRDRLLVVSEVYYPAGWTAAVNGVETEIVQVNHLLRGVPVASGESEVSFVFDPASQRNGILITGLGTAITYSMLLFFGFTAMRRRRMISSLEKEESSDE